MNKLEKSHSEIAILKPAASHMTSLSRHQYTNLPHNRSKKDIRLPSISPPREDLSIERKSHNLGPSALAGFGMDRRQDEKMRFEPTIVGPVVSSDQPKRFGR